MTTFLVLLAVLLLGCGISLRLHPYTAAPDRVSAATAAPTISGYPGGTSR